MSKGAGFCWGIAHSLLKTKVEGRELASLLLFPSVWPLPDNAVRSFKVVGERSEKQHSPST